MAQLIHLAEIGNEKKELLELMLEDDGIFRWYRGKAPTEVAGATFQEAMKKGAAAWRLNYFSSVRCGTKFSLPERDEHGTPATYREMQLSLQSMNGVFFDEASGHVAIVKEIPSRFFLVKKV